MDYNRFTYELQARNFPVSKSRRSPAPHQSPATHQPPPQVGRGAYSLPTGSAHADGGATRAKKRFSLAARHRFFEQAPKKWGRIAGQAIDYRPTYRRTRTRQRQEKGEPPARVPPWTPSCALISIRRVPRSAERGQGLCPWTLPPLKRRAKLSFALRAAKHFIRAYSCP